MGKKKFSADYQLMFRLLKLFLFIGFIVALFFLFLNLTVGDIFVSLLAFMPTGWALLSVCSLSSVIFFPLYIFDHDYEKGLSLRHTLTYMEDFIYL